MWMKHTEASKEMYQRTVEKSVTKLQKSGFTMLIFLKMVINLTLYRIPFIWAGMVDWHLIRQLILYISNPQPAPEYRLAVCVS